MASQLVSQRESSHDEKRVLGFDTAHAFLAILLVDAEVKADDKRLHTAQEDLKTTTAEYKAQLTTINDVTRAEIEVSGAQRQLEQDKGALESAYISLEFLINAKVARSFVTPTALITASQVPPPRPEALLDAAYKVRPDLLASRDAATAAHDFAREPHLRFVPTLTAQGTVVASTLGELDNHDADANLAVVLRAQGRAGEADALQSRTLLGLSQVLGAEHPNVLALRDWKLQNRDLEAQPT